MPTSDQHGLSGQPAPRFEAVATNRRDVAIPALGRTKVTVVDFWASWCATCRATIPTLSELYDDERREGVLVVGVSIDESTAPADAYLRSIGASFPNVMDSYQRLAGAFGVQQVPLTFVVDEHSRVRWVGRDPDKASEAARALLREYKDGSPEAY